MQTVLFHDTIFGPIHSRRLGTSLGVNLTPNDGKICSFDCLYCEAGFNAQGPGTTGFAPRSEVGRLLEEKLKQIKAAAPSPQPPFRAEAEVNSQLPPFRAEAEVNSQLPPFRGEAEASGLDVITFSGNGEPTLHPEFPGIVDDTLRLRDKYFPNAKVSVLTNSTRLHSPEVVAALKRVDNNILKLDSAVDSTIKILDRPNTPGFSAEKVIEQLKQFAGTGIIQTMMLRGQWDGKRIDNTLPAEVDALIEAYKQIRPREIMLYSIDRPTPARTLEKIPADELRAIGERIAAETSIPVQVS